MEYEYEDENITVESIKNEDDWTVLIYPQKSDMRVVWKGEPFDCVKTDGNGLRILGSVITYVVYLHQLPEQRARPDKERELYVSAIFTKKANGTIALIDGIIALEDI